MTPKRDRPEREKSPWCVICKGTGLVKAQPDMARVKRLYGQDATAASAQPTVRRCECR